MTTRRDVEVAERLAAIAERAAALVTPAEAGLVGTLAARYFEFVPRDDIRERDPDDLARAVVGHFELARLREPGVAAVHVWSPVAPDGRALRRTVVDVVSDDMPFLVDSVRMELNRHGYAVALIAHPQVPVRRDADGVLTGIGDAGAPVESFLHFEIGRLPGHEALAELHRNVLRVLGDVRAAVDDWPDMHQRALELVERLRTQPPPLPEPEVAEGRAFLEWLADDHFTFLGYREYDLVTEGGVDALRIVDGRGLGILRGPHGGSRASASFLALPAEARRHARDRELLLLTKANSRSTVHRPVFLDYVGVRRFDAEGNVDGEYRFLGLYASSAYHDSPTTIPVLRRKYAYVRAQAGFPVDGHSGRDLVQTLEAYPRDELFQISGEELLETALGILELQERQRVRLFVRRDLFGRFFSCLVFVPRDRYTTAVRRRIERVLVDAFGGQVGEYATRVSESVLARLHFVVFTDPMSHQTYDVRALEEELEAASRTWADALADALVDAFGEDGGDRLARSYEPAFPAAYQEDVAPRDAVVDVQRLEALGDDDFAIDLYVPADAPPGAARFKLYRSGGPVALSTILPMFEHLGVTVVDERPYGVTPVNGPIRWIYDFGLRHPPDADLASTIADARFEDAFAQAWRGDVESDGFNRLVLLAGLNAHEVTIVRALCRYLRQTGTPFSQDYIERTLCANAAIARRLVDLFIARHDPEHHDEDAGADLVTNLGSAIDAVTTLDEDRILRMFLHLVQAVVRTNAFQRDADGRRKRTLSFKLDSALVPDLPLPRPHFEIFVCSPRVEGVHLRVGFVARGGIRWSDRREDFRTEVLGLMKAQTVKNAVIVPVGAKGGFVVKQPPADTDALAAEVQACYRAFISALLDVTDNLVGAVATRPEGVVVHDEQADAYLVVAADKGTATFSDIANEISLARGFWLGDAFASGGSTGYDHKSMGITARGAWESVRRHFREVGVDADRAPITVAGIGDMSGDVFGNGMLRSPHLRLVAAFDHRHVFVDPDPDPARSFEERKRLFALPRSSWADYDPAALSGGGGVWPRSAKSVTLSPQAQAALRISEATLTPAEVVRAILRAPVDLLWNGGIGTYVKAHDESNLEVGDKSNDAVRVDGRDLRCRVVAEGGNLGFTERGRVEYALTGGRINTDAIDNSAGVDCSDHEVNLKILLDDVVASGQLTVDERNALLASMTDEVAAHVLRDNYEQNQALGNARHLAEDLLDVHARYLHALERAGRLDRAVESLPDDEALAERAGRDLGLTSPELCVLLAYAKITLGHEILGTRLVSSPYVGHFLHAYFPAALRERFADAIDRHSLHREIVATVLANTTVNRAGTSFVFRMTEETGAHAADVVAAHLVARDLFDMPRFWAGIEALDGAVDIGLQTDLILAARLLVERGARWLLRHRDVPLDPERTAAELRDGVSEVAASLPELLVGGERERYERTIHDLVGAGVVADVAAIAASLPPMGAALDIVEVGRTSGRSIADAAAVYLALGERLRLDRLRDRIAALPRRDRWQTGARSALRDELADERRALTADILGVNGVGDPLPRLDSWLARNPAARDRYAEIDDEIEASAEFDLTTLSVAVRELRELRTREES